MMGRESKQQTHRQHPPTYKVALVILPLLLLAATPRITSAQTPARKPSEATRPVVVMSAASVEDLNKKLRPGNKTEDLIDSAGMELRVAIQHEENTTGTDAEVHDGSDDVYYV